MAGVRTPIVLRVGDCQHEEVDLLIEYLPEYLICYIILTEMTDKVHVVRCGDHDRMQEVQDTDGPYIMVADSIATEKNILQDHSDLREPSITLIFSG